MKAKIFYDINSFNAWAKGKALTRDVILHTITWERNTPGDTGFAIVVFHPENDVWDKVQTE